MRGTPDLQMTMLATLSTESLIPPDHPIRRIRIQLTAGQARLRRRIAQQASRNPPSAPEC